MFGGARHVHAAIKAHTPGVKACGKRGVGKGMLLDGYSGATPAIGGVVAVAPQQLRAAGSSGSCGSNKAERGVSAKAIVRPPLTTMRRAVEAA